MNYSVVLPCAGIGSRMNLGYNKLLLKMANGRTVLENTLQVFIDDKRCREIILAIGENDKEVIETLVSDDRIALVLGGATRQESVYRGLLACHEDYVLIHDGARPFLKSEAISRILQCLETKNACLLMVPVKDTIKVVASGVVKHTPKRETLFQAQTPQAFKRSLLLEAFNQANAQGFVGTDDASIMEAFGKESVYLVEGDYDNIKITTPEDLRLDK